ncbi:MAG: orotate phosphoribosyltransferase [Candidatus Bathyarchaeota archaeon]|nr:orotate phosphoribosyltransferase [Candidatus Bathyarchaeota archaeon]
MVPDKIKDEFVEDLIKIEALKFGKFKLTSGKESFYYIDLRVAPSYPEVFQRFINAYLVKVREIGLEKFDVIAGIPTSGLIYASTLAYNIKKPLIYVRKEEKSWGRERKLEGILRDGDSVLLVDDLITTGKSLTDAAESIEDEGGKVNYALVLVDREEGGLEKLRNKGIVLFSFIGVSEIFKVLVRKGRISNEEYEKLKFYGKL